MPEYKEIPDKPSFVHGAKFTALSNALTGILSNGSALSCRWIFSNRSKSDRLVVTAALSQSQVVASKVLGECNDSSVFTGLEGRSLIR